MKTFVLGLIVSTTSFAINENVNVPDVPHIEDISVAIIDLDQFKILHLHTAFTLAYAAATAYQGLDKANNLYERGVLDSNSSEDIKKIYRDEVIPDFDPEHHLFFQNGLSQHWLDHNKLHSMIQNINNNTCPDEVYFAFAMLYRKVITEEILDESDSVKRAALIWTQIHSIQNDINLFVEYILIPKYSNPVWTAEIKSNLIDGIKHLANPAVFTSHEDEKTLPPVPAPNPPAPASKKTPRLLAGLAVAAVAGAAGLYYGTRSREDDLSLSDSETQDLFTRGDTLKEKERLKLKALQEKTTKILSSYSKETRDLISRLRLAKEGLHSEKEITSLEEALKKLKIEPKKLATLIKAEKIEATFLLHPALLEKTSQGL